jgi:transcriptional regulator with XRE-family HTH domain
MTRLEFLRRRAGLNQADLGARIHYGRNSISVLERKRPSPEQVCIRLKAALEGFFGEPLENLLSPVECSEQKCLTWSNTGGCHEARHRQQDVVLSGKN